MYFSDEKAPEKRFKKILWLEPAWGVHQVSGKNNAREDWKLTDPDGVNAKSDGICWHVLPFFLLEQTSVSPCVFCSTHRSQEDRIWARVLLSVKALNKNVQYLGTIRKDKVAFVHVPSHLKRNKSNTITILACENSRFSSLFPAGDVSRGRNVCDSESGEKRLFSQAIVIPSLALC